MFIWNAAIEELIQFQEPFLLNGYVPRQSTLKGTRRKTENYNTSTQKKKRERHHGKNPDGSSSATYHKKEKAVNCNPLQGYISSLLCNEVQLFHFFSVNHTLRYSFQLRKLIPQWFQIVQL
ncbi:hypothetical protein AVEN_274255-1 [Araneus ventricosus]|uniref:Uncharacterized protein n=1 Tax=Araneus ventricosus TaxID=182803 RepID=A0A4Y2I4I8_ARAVE|nr:hypothetical protein AVEN_274255-1 [Araneus ventricosus]